jgi:phosphoribosylformylglycinamidine cyclo-ligase
MSSDAYRAAGVHRNTAAEAKKLIGQHARSTFTSGVLGDIGGFGSLFQVQGFKDPVLVSHTDGVGTKLLVGALMGQFDTLGEDLVHHCVNDILTTGARPLFFLDYIGMGSLVPERVEALVKGMARACRRIDCALIGGETAEMPGLYHGDDLDVVGFVVGAVERSEVLDGHTVQEGDVLIGLPSSGLHTNGFSLVRQIFGIDDNPDVLFQEFPELGTTLGEALLAPHRCYYPSLGPLRRYIKAMAHITGGGFPDNVPRVFPDKFRARINLGSWKPPGLFRLIQDRGQVDQDEMYRVFNMGMGMVLMAGVEEATSIQAALPDARIIGQIEERGDGDAVVFSA